MDPAGNPKPGVQDLYKELIHQREHQDQLLQFMNSIATRLDACSATIPAFPTVTASPQLQPAQCSHHKGSGIHLPLPPCYNGNPKGCRGFLNQCSIHFELQASLFPSDRAKVAFIVSLLSGEALAWANPLWERCDPAISDLQIFLSHFRTVFEEPGRTASAASALLRLRQGTMTVGQYAIQFRTLASELAWNNEALVAAFWEGLAGQIKDELAGRDLPATLDDLISLATRIDLRFRERLMESTREKRSLRLAPRFQRPLLVPVSAPPEEPIPVERFKLSEEEQQRRRRNNLCLYCGGKAHYVRNCPLKSGKLLGLGLVGETLLGGKDSSPKLSMPVTLSCGNTRLSVQAYVDSGSAGNFIHQGLVARFQIPTIRLERPLSVASVNGQPLPELILSVTEPLLLQVGALHTEKISLYVLPKSVNPLLLGLPWLRLHAPILDWNTGQVLRWGSHCHTSCLTTVCPISKPPASRSVPGLPAQYSQYGDVFSKKEAETLPPHRPYDCPIDLLPGTSPPRGRVYPLSLPETQAMTDYIKENLDRGFIRKSSSPAGAGFFFVQKKDGSLRPCIDYRGLNKITVKNKYPLPLMSELFDRIQGAKIFTKLDLRGAYNLIRIRKGDEWKTAFNTRDGHYEYLVMPFGLCNAPAVFQELVNDIFRDLLYVCVVVYLDDILIYSPDLTSHRKHVRLVLQRLRENRLYAKMEKCIFEKSSLPFLGYIVSDQGLQMDPEKLSAVLDWPRPQGLRAIQRFLGFANFYRQFIPHFSSVTAPISALTKKGVNARNWSPEAETAFQELKKSFASAPVLRHPDVSKQFFLEVDASSVGAGAVLFQRNCQGKNQTCGYFSKLFSPAERNYTIGDRELLAIKLALEEWRYLLEGASHQVIIYTDHKNLTYLQTAQRLNPRQARWSLFFSRFNFSLYFRPADKNVKADALSRSFDSTDQAEEPQHIIDPTCIISVAPVVMRDIPPGKTFVPTAKRRRVLSWGHNSKLAGHQGTRKTQDLISRHFWWPTLPKDVHDFVSACTVCARNKSSRLKPAGLLQPLPVPDSPWQHIAMDFITDLPSSAGCTVIWVVVDRFSKMAHFTPLSGLPSANRLASLFIQHIFRLHGLPLNIVSDRGVQFTSKFWRALCGLLEVQLDFSSAYHPQSNGQVERVNQILENYLRHFVSARQDDWMHLLPWAEFSYNNHSGESTGSSPFNIVYGQHPKVPLPLSALSEVPAANSVYRDFLRIWQQTKTALVKAVARMKKNADRRRRAPPQFAPGDRVWLSSRNIRMKIPSYKFAPRFLGPFEINKQINPVTYRLCLPPTLRIPNSFHVSLLKPLVLNRYSKSSVPKPVSAPVGPGEVYEIKDIIDCKRVGKRTFYLVDWKGFGPEERSWEPEENIDAPALLKKFSRLSGAKKRERGSKGGGTVTLPACFRQRVPSSLSTRGRCGLRSSFKRKSGTGPLRRKRVLAL